MEKYFKMSYLIDIYSSLLTHKQLKVLEYYYDDDISLSEIASMLNISRQGVYDTLKRAEKIILEYDEKLNLLKKYEENIELLNRLEELSKDKESLSLIKEIRENL
ncbi:YlxM family DNA-binding protein [Anaerofustis stercorihominis]|uniref:YlxM family DNA-binding protein n=1 Tax=Anaerofustis stercorihominis TaxID=214853 RepID=UPI00214C16FB|nr:YlxM family DNA-binding protein [Anaerofustis stercorihominis]MCR2033470.1 YlxM family DNA-binding protein [Anaerofustis stercorihominis]